MASAEQTALPFCLSAILKASKRTAIISASFMVFGPTSLKRSLISDSGMSIKDKVMTVVLTTIDEMEMLENR
jgi:hypothetical protein